MLQSHVTLSRSKQIPCVSKSFLVHNLLLSSYQTFLVYDVHINILMIYLHCKICISWSILPPLYLYNPTFPLEAMSPQSSITAVSSSPSLQVLRLSPLSKPTSSIYPNNTAILTNTSLVLHMCSCSICTDRMFSIPLGKGLSSCYLHYVQDLFNTSEIFI